MYRELYILYNCIIIYINKYDSTVKEVVRKLIWYIASGSFLQYVLKTGK